MSLERYLKDDNGIRKYVEFLETTPTAKRQALMIPARKENPFFVETAEKYILTFERITQLPPMELTEVLGSNLKPETLAVAILSVEDPAVRERLVQNIPRNVSAPIQLEMRDRPPPKPADVGAARLNVIKKARELEREGKLVSMQMPRFTANHFAKRAA